MIWLDLASVDELKLDPVPTLYAAAVVIVQADLKKKNFISWAFCNHCDPHPQDDPSQS